MVGCFAAEMFLRKSFRVLRYWKHALAVAAAMTLLCAAFALDWFGIENKVPDVGNVASLTLSTDLGYPYDTAQNFDAEMTDPAQIQKAVELHRAIVRDKDRLDRDSFTYQPGEDWAYIRLDYTLTSGAHLERYYSIPIYQSELAQEGSVTWWIRQLTLDRDLVEECYGFDRCEEGRLVEAYLTDLYQLSEDGSRKEQSNYYLGVSGEELEGLWKAVRADFDEGTIGVRYLFEDEERMENTCRTDLTFSFEMTSRESGSEVSTSTYYRDLTITLTPNARRTLAWLEEYSGLGESYELRPHVAGEEDEDYWEAVLKEQAVNYATEIG